MTNRIAGYLQSPIENTAFPMSVGGACVVVTILPAVVNHPDVVSLYRVAEEAARREVEAKRQFRATRRFNYRWN